MSSQVLITGHSLGAALAVLCAMDLHYAHGLPMATLYTFGKPRVGNVAFAKWYDTSPFVSWRVTHWRDPVPHLPMQSLGFQHDALESFYTEDSKTYRVCACGAQPGPRMYEDS